MPSEITLVEELVEEYPMPAREIMVMQEKIEQTKALLGLVRGSSVRVGQLLYEIKQQLDKDVDWGDFLRDEFDIGESFASKLMKIHQVLVLEGGVSQEDIEGIDGEKLYLVAGLEGSAQEKVSMARTLTRREIKEHRNDQKPHEHIPVSICKVCSIRLHEENATTA